MSPGRRIVLYLAALSVAACAEEISTAVSAGSIDDPQDLPLSIPVVTPDLFVTHTRIDHAATGPALALGGELPPEYEPPPDYAPAADIWNAYTDLWFWPGQLEAWGEHDYVGNKGRVDVSADVRHDGVTIGSRTGITEEGHFFLNPFPHHIIGNVIINLDRECGLTADAYSSHSAWWEVTPGAGPHIFDRDTRNTNSGLASQPACAPTSGSGGGSGGGGGGIDNGGAEGTLDHTCWMWFSYDEVTLEILDIHGTWCTGGG
jgi:hypothetical protein